MIRLTRLIRLTRSHRGAPADRSHARTPGGTHARVAGPLMALVAGLCLCACSSSHTSEGTSELSASSFASPDAPGVGAVAADANRTPVTMRTVVAEPTGAVGAPVVNITSRGSTVTAPLPPTGAKIPEVVGTSPGSAPGTPPSSSNITTTVNTKPPVNAGSTPAGTGAIIDALVGQINGRPVFASEILEPLSGRLRALSGDPVASRNWSRRATEIIVEELRRRIEDELILAEARASLTPEQRAGVFRFINEIQKSLVSNQRGSAVAADETLRETSGRGLYQEAKDRLDRQLIVKELRERIMPKVNVSWRDIQQEYERDYDRFNPPSVATLRLAYALVDTPDAVEALKVAVAAGKPFAEIAALPINEFNPKTGGKIERSFTGNYADAEFSPIPELNAAFRSLSVGQVIGPIEYAVKNERTRTESKRVGFVYLEKIDLPSGLTLYDAQLTLETELRTKRTDEEVRRYFERLRKRGNVSKIEDMTARLLEIATERYAPASAKRK